MKAKHLLLLSLFFYSTITSAQLEYWQKSYTTISAGNRMNAVLFERDQTFVSFSRNVLLEETYFLEAEESTTVPMEGSTLFSNYFYITEIENGDTPFFFAAERTNGLADGSLFLRTFTKSADLNSGFEIAEAFEEEQSKGPAAVQVTNNEVIIFANQHFYKIGIDTDGGISIVWSKPVDYGLIADAKPYNDGYILCNTNGKLVHVDVDGEEIWEEDLGFPLRGVLVLNDGFLLAAEIDEEKGLVKTDANGNLLWQKKYGGGFSTNLDFSNEDGFVFTGFDSSQGTFVIKTDTEGEEIWENFYDAIGRGINIIRSQFGGYLLQSRSNPSTTISRIAEDGSTGPVVSGMLPKRIEANNIATTASAGGQIFWDGEDTNTTYPKDSSTTTIFAGGLLISGVDQNEELHTAFSQYIQTDFSPGPFSADTEELQGWDRVWRVTKEQINNFRADIEDGALDRATPLDLWTYPGTGNPNFNMYTDQTIDVPEGLAPFVDVNNDGIYNILDGDYPDIKGDDQIWWVMSNKSSGTNLGGTPLEVQVKGTLYAYECGASPILYNSAFLDLEITNFSTNDYSDMYLGMFIDYDIGCFLDDYIGTIPQASALVGYNDNFLDGEGGCQGVESFAQGEIPLQSVSFLNTTMDYSMYSTNQGISNPEMETRPPGTPEELHNFLQANWADGSPLTRGGNGYGGTDPVPSVFPGNPANNSEWSMCTENLAPIDRIMYIITGPETLASNEEELITIGIMAHEVDYNCPNTNLVRSEISDLRLNYMEGGLDFNLFLGPDRDIEEGETIILDAGEGAASYSWSTEETTASINVTSPGIYSVTITTEGGCEYVDEVNIGGVTSLNEVERNAPKVYPNPAGDKIYVELNDNVPTMITLENILGQVIKTYSLEAGLGHTDLELDISAASRGIHLLRFHFNDDKNLVRKIIIAN